MCGIMGYVGKREAVPALLKGLKALEYRGYDSSGIAVHSGEDLSVVKRSGRIANLEKALAEHPLSGHCGIGHTRWATHGVATDLNAHPFLSECGKFAVVHNGIITNYRALAAFLERKGVTLRSDTDSEVVAHLIDCYYEGDVLSALCRAARELRGSFALGVISIYEPEVLYGVRKDSPLIVGRGDGESALCSDFSGFFDICDECCPLRNGEIVRVTPTGARLFDFSGKERPISFVKREREEIGDLEDGEDFMHREIAQTPLALSAGCRAFPKEALAPFLHQGFSEILVLGCGSAYNAGLIFKGVLRDFLGTFVRDEIASEFLARPGGAGKGTLVLAVSQSGETADTLLAVRKAKRAGATVLSVCNVPASSLVRASDYALITKCGRERAVAATKSYVAQVHALLMIALLYAEVTGKADPTALAKLRAELASLPEKVTRVLQSEPLLARLAEEAKDAKAIFFLGRGQDYYAAREGSLKLKEITYLFSEAYPAGELKHGTLALMEKGVFGVIVATDLRYAEKYASTLAEITCRGASAIVIATEKVAAELPAERRIILPNTDPLFAPVLSAVAMQEFAYFVAKKRGCDVDKPRNLAKSVTVE